jgi:hypothetical protein
MRRSVIVTLVVLAIAVVPSIAAAADCQYHNVKFEFKSAAWLDPPIAPYDACLHLGKIVGTLNGEYLVCFYFADFIPSDDIYADGFFQIEAEKYYSWISTKKGDITMIEWAWIDWDFGLETGFAKVVGGTGDYENAFGSLSYTPRFPNLDPVVWLEGYVCTP